jgi:hypothetical protein
MQPAPNRAHLLAQVGICVQFLALGGGLAEIVLRHHQGPALDVALAIPFVGGALLAALPCIAVLCYFAGWVRAAIGVAGLAIVALLVMKVVLINP